LSILGIQRSFAGCDIGVSRIVQMSSLQDLPEEIEYEENRYPDVGCQKVGDVPMAMMLTNEHIKTVEDNDEGKVYEREPSSVRLEVTLEDKCVAVNALCLERLVELEVSNTD